MRVNDLRRYQLRDKITLRWLSKKVETRMKRLLIGLELVMGIVAIGCGLLLMSGRADRLQMDQDVLEGSPFRGFTIPGIILTVVVGGSNFSERLASS